MCIFPICLVVFLVLQDVDMFTCLTENLETVNGVFCRQTSKSRAFRYTLRPQSRTPHQGYVTRLPEAASLSCPGVGEPGRMDWCQENIGQK